MPPTATATVRCQHCAEDFITRRPKQAKWCPSCRTAKAILALGQRPATCLACDQAYFKHDRSQTICTTCSGSPVGESRPAAPCAFCDRCDRLQPGLRVCYPCGGSAGKVHTRVVKAMARYLANAAQPDPAIAA